MATLEIIEDRDNKVEAPPELVLEEEGLTDVQLRALLDWAKAITKKVNAGINIGSPGTNGARAGNLDAQIVDVVTPVFANVEFAVPHGLGRVPAGFDVLNPSAAINVYVPTATKYKWTDSVLYLYADASNATIQLRVF